MLSQERKEELSSIIETLKEQIISLHTHIENSSVEQQTYEEIDQKTSSLLILIGDLEQEIYFS